MRTLAASILPIAGALAIAYGCVGDDPVAGNPGDAGTASSSSGGSSSGGSSSGGSSSGGSSGDGGSEAGPPTCAGKTFGTPVPIDVSAITGLGTPGYLWGPRVVGNKAYFAATVAGDQRLFTSAIDLGEGRLGTRTELVPASAGSGAEWAPSASADESFVVFAYNTTLGAGRDLYSAQLPGGAPMIEATLNKGGPDVDDTDPYLVGSPTKAVYYASGPNGAAQSIFRSGRVSGAFLAPIGLLQPGQCPKAYCGTPVVTTDEKTILFAAWDAGGFVPNVREAALQPATTPYMSGFVDHPELGNRYPSWVSDDGCTVIVAHGEPNQLFVARRSAN